MPGKRVFIAEKPSVARQFADALGISFRSRDGYLESPDTIVTWCVGHLVTMSYPDAYDEKYRRWSFETLPFLPETYRYEVIDSCRKQYEVVKRILTSPDVDTICICTDSGREGEYIYRLVAMEAGVTGKRQLRVWIDSQTREEVLRGIREAKDDSAYDCLGDAAFLRAKEDYLMGINFSRALTLRYGYTLKNFLGADRCVIAVGRVMTCVLGMVVRREREIRSFQKTSYYRIQVMLALPQKKADEEKESADHTPVFRADWHRSDSSVIQADDPRLYGTTGFLKKEDAFALIHYLQTGEFPSSSVFLPLSEDPDGTAHFGPSVMDAPGTPCVETITRKKEKKRPPLLYNLAELQNDCSRFFRISPDQTLDAAQELYEKKLTTYPRTDARVLSSAVAKEITNNLNGLFRDPAYKPYVQEIASLGTAPGIGKTRYTDDKAITDHYAIIPTGQGQQALSSLSPVVRNVYELIVRRFLAIFYPPAVFDKMSLQVRIRTELFSASVKTCVEEGYLKVLRYSFSRKKAAADEGKNATRSSSGEHQDEEQDSQDPSLSTAFAGMKRGMRLRPDGFLCRTGETKPPARYNSGSMILAMENAGQLIEEEELREQIRGSGIGTSATRAEILKKLVQNRYLSLARNTQIITPTQLGEMVYDTVSCSLRPLLDPRLTASWEKGLSGVAAGTVSRAEYMEKLTDFVTRRTNHVKSTDYRAALTEQFRQISRFYHGKEQSSQRASTATHGAKRTKKSSAAGTGGRKEE